MGEECVSGTVGFTIAIVTGSRRPCQQVSLRKKVSDARFFVTRKFVCDPGGF